MCRLAGLLSVTRASGIVGLVRSDSSQEISKARYRSVDMHHRALCTWAYQIRFQQNFSREVCRLAGLLSVYALAYGLVRSDNRKSARKDIDWLT